MNIRRHAVLVIALILSLSAALDAGAGSAYLAQRAAQHAVHRAVRHTDVLYGYAYTALLIDPDTYLWSELRWFGYVDQYNVRHTTSFSYWCQDDVSCTARDMVDAGWLPPDWDPLPPASADGQFPAPVQEPVP